MKIRLVLKNRYIQASQDEKYLNHVGHFSYVKPRSTFSHSVKTSHLGEIVKLLHMLVLQNQGNQGLVIKIGYIKDHLIFCKCWQSMTCVIYQKTITYILISSSLTHVKNLDQTLMLKKSLNVSGYILWYTMYAVLHCHVFCFLGDFILYCPVYYICVTTSFENIIRKAFLLV